MDIKARENSMQDTCKEASNDKKEKTIGNSPK